MRGPKQRLRGQDWAFDLGDYSTYATSTYAELTVHVCQLLPVDALVESLETEEIAST